MFGLVFDFLQEDGGVSLIRLDVFVHAVIGLLTYDPTDRDIVLLSPELQAVKRPAPGGPQVVSDLRLFCPQTRFLHPAGNCTGGGNHPHLS